MKVTITDSEPFATLNPLDVKAYLITTGWHQERTLPDRGAFWQHPGHELSQVPLPYGRFVGDFADRMRDAVEGIAEVEDRSSVEVLEDLRRAGQDVIRVRLASPQIENGSVALSQGVGLLESARNAVYACALAASSRPRRAYYYSRPSKVVSDFMEEVRLAQAERGSYVVAIEAPVTPELIEGTEDTPEPFSRTVTPDNDNCSEESSRRR